MASERTEGPTPHGGAYAVITYLDDQREEAERDEATQAELIEYSAEHEQVFRTHVFLGSKRNRLFV